MYSYDYERKSLYKKKGVSVYQSEPVEKNGTYAQDNNNYRVLNEGETCKEIVSTNYYCYTYTSFVVKH